MAPRLHLIVVPGDEAPIYRQIMRQIRDAVAGGRLAAGEQLPSHRDLAQALVIAPLTVKKAYDELEREGVVETRRGSGTFVVGARGHPEGPDASEALRPLARRLAQDAHLRGVATADIVRLVRDEASRLKADRRSSMTLEDE